MQLETIASASTDPVAMYVQRESPLNDYFGVGFCCCAKQKKQYIKDDNILIHIIKVVYV